jgi:NgoMIV restriction enzyme
MTSPFFEDLRKKFHAALLRGPLTWDGSKWANADKASRLSKKFAARIADQLKEDPVVQAKAAGQTLGRTFENVVREFVTEGFATLNHLRPGNWSFVFQAPAKKKRKRGSEPEEEELADSANILSIASFQQYEHLDQFRQLAKKNKELARALGAILAKTISSSRTF